MKTNSIRILNTFRTRIPTNLFEIQRVLSVCGRVCVLDVRLQQFELFGRLFQNLGQEVMN